MFLFVDRHLSEILTMTKGKGPSSVVDPPNLGTDLDPRIRTTDFHQRMARCQHKLGFFKVYFSYYF